MFISRRLGDGEIKTVLCLKSIAHFIWQTLLASLMFGASQLLCSCSLLIHCLLVLYEVIEQETILLTSYKLQLRALRVLLAVSTLSASRTFIQLSQYAIYNMRQTACLVFNPIMVEGCAALFSCTAVVQASDSMTASM